MACGLCSSADQFCARPRNCHRARNGRARTPEQQSWNFLYRGIYSVVTVLTVAFFVVLFAWFGWWDNILRFIPHLAARANVGFYLMFSTALLIVWLLAVFGFDRMTVWRVRPGQMIGGRARSFDTNSLVFEKRSRDLFHDVILGLALAISQSRLAARTKRQFQFQTCCLWIGR